MRPSWNKMAHLTSFYSEIKLEWKSENGWIIKCSQKLFVKCKTHNNFFFLQKHSMNTLNDHQEEFNDQFLYFDETRINKLSNFFTWGTIFCFFCFFIKFWNIGTENNLIISTSKRLTNFFFWLTNPSKLIASCTDTVMRWVCTKKELKKCNLEETHKLLPAD